MNKERVAEVAGMVIIAVFFLFAGYCFESPSALMVGTAENQAGRGDYDGAIKSFNKALEMSPDSWYVLEHRGEFYLEIGRFEEAAADLTRVLDLTADFDLLGRHRIYRERGDAYRGLSRYDEAIADYTRAIELRRNNASALFGRGLAHWGAGRRTEALADLGRACGLGVVAACEEYDSISSGPGR